MPVVRIDLWEGRNIDTRRKLIQSVSRAVSESLDIPCERVHVILNEVSKDNWGMKGEQASRLEGGAK